MRTDTIELRVRYGETDKMGHVYYAHHLAYFEVGRTEYLRKLGTTYRDLEERGVFLVVIEVQCNYRGPARYDDVIEMETWVERLRPTRIDFRHRLRRKEDGAPVAEGGEVLACVDADRRPQPLPADVQRALEGFKGGEG